MLPTAFDRWLEMTFAREGAFTAFLILFEETQRTIAPLASSYVHVTGIETRWADILTLLETSGMAWNSVAVFAAKDPAEGPIPDVSARRRLASLEQAVLRDRLTVKKGELFNRAGQRLDLVQIADH